jgi:hypothetical protein
MTPRDIVSKIIENYVTSLMDDPPRAVQSIVAVTLSKCQRVTNLWHGPASFSSEQISSFDFTFGLGHLREHKHVITVYTRA